MEYKDYYKILGVSREASEADIKRAYRKLAREYHPDKNQAKGAEDRFKSANEANEVLSDPKKRAAYDQLGHNWQNGQRFTPPPGWSHGPGRHTDAGGFSDFFSSLFGGGLGGNGNGFEEVSSFSGGGGRDQQARLAISLEDSYNGATRRVALGNRTINVRIPMGVIEGQTVRLAGQAARGGDVLLEITFVPHAQFRAEGRDIHVTLNVAPWEAALGGSVPVPTLGGIVDLNLPPGTASGRKMRLKGRGLPGSTPSGDQFVTIQIVNPTVATDAQKQVYELMRTQFTGFDPRL